MSFSQGEQPSFKDAQLNYQTVFQAFADKGEGVYGQLAAEGIDRNSFDLFIRAFKFEEDLEVWAKNKNESEYSLITTYKFCENVGDLGPKRKEGDLQIPEGCYKIDRLNPKSQFYLSLGLCFL